MLASPLVLPARKDAAPASRFRPRPAPVFRL